MYEETIRGTLQEVLEHFLKQEPKGEFVIVLAGRTKEKRTKEKGE
jgi:16S rRNA (cytidine1402-2'-O)-methyltransferase